MNSPVKFYGAELRNIRTEAQAVEALDNFIKNASDEEIATACEELEHQEQPVRSIINQLLWKLEYGLSSTEWTRCFELKYHSA